MPNTSLFRVAALTVVTLALSAACSEDETPPALLPEGPPDLRILSFDAPGVHTGIDDGGRGACFPVGGAPKRACETPVSGSECGFVVVLDTNGSRQIPLELPDGSLPRFWTFKPPLGCNGAPDCGYALLLIDPTSAPCAARPAAALQKIAAGPVISVEFEELRNGLNSAFGPKTVRVELWPGEGIPDKDHCHFATATIDFEPSCGPTDGGITDAPTDTTNPESGPRDAAPEAGDASDGSPDARSDAVAPDSSVHDASDAAPQHDGSVDAASDGG